jgi:hypothetical protein
VNQWWGVGAVFVLGAVIVVYGWLSDRMASKRRAAELREAPQTSIPDLPTPQYVVDLPVRDTELTNAERAEVAAKLATAEKLPGGFASADFTTDRPSQQMILDGPLILVAENALNDLRELLPAIRLAKAKDRPLVVAAPGFGQRLLEELAANAAMGTMRLGPVVMERTAQEALSTLAGAQLVPSADLHAGYLPAENLGECQLWASDAAHSWIVAGAQSLN